TVKIQRERKRVSPWNKPCASSGEVAMSPRRSLTTKVSPSSTLTGWALIFHLGFARCRFTRPFLFDLCAHQAVELLRQGHVAVNFDASLHIRSEKMSPAFNYVDEIRLVTADRAVGIALLLLDMGCAIIDGDKPAAHLVDIEKVSSVDAAQNRLVLLLPVTVKYFLGGFWHLVCPPFNPL